MIVVLPESQEDQLFLGKKRKLGSLHCHFYNWGAWRRLSPGGVWNSRWQRRAEVGLPCPHPWPLTWGTQTGSSPSRSSASALPSPGLCLDPVWPFLVQSSISILESEASLALRSVRTGVLESVRVCLTPGGQLRLEGKLWSTTPNSQGLMVLFYALTPPPPPKKKKESVRVTVVYTQGLGDQVKGSRFRQWTLTTIGCWFPLSSKSFESKRTCCLWLLGWHIQNCWYLTLFNL